MEINVKSCCELIWEVMEISRSLGVVLSGHYQNYVKSNILDSKASTPFCLCLLLWRTIKSQRFPRSLWFTTRSGRCFPHLIRVPTSPNSSMQMNGKFLCSFCTSHMWWSFQVCPASWSMCVFQCFLCYEIGVMPCLRWDEY